MDCILGAALGLFCTWGLGAQCQPFRSISLGGREKDFCKVQFPVLNAQLFLSS